MATVTMTPFPPSSAIAKRSRRDIKVNAVIGIFRVVTHVTQPKTHAIRERMKSSLKTGTAYGKPDGIQNPHDRVSPLNYMRP